MRNKQRQHMSFEDSFYRDFSKEVQRCGRIDSIEDIHMVPESNPKRNMMKLTCLECSRRFKSSNAVPSCPGCGGSDVELQ